MSDTSLRATGVPFLDLWAANEAIAEDVLEDVRDLVRASSFVNGPAVTSFEERFAEYVGVAHCVGVASGLDALRIALEALGVGPGDEVIVPAMTFVATWEAVSQAGATPVPVDVSAVDYGLDPDAVEASIGERTRAIMPVHLYGQMADMGAVAELARRHGLAVVEDAAQAHGARRDGRRAGAVSSAGAFSFYPGKNLGAFGDAGALVTDDAAVAETSRALREHGQRRKYEHDLVGWTARLDAIQAAVLSRKLPLLDRWNDERRSLASAYLEALAGVGDLVLPTVAEGSEPVWHLFVVRTEDPRGLADHLRERRIATGFHYPEPPHLSRAYASLGYEAGSFPVAEAVARECLSLPIFPGMTRAEVETVAEATRLWFERG